MRTALAGLHLEGNGGSWSPGAGGDGWSGGGGGCGGDCGCGGSCGGDCGCKSGGGSCGGKPTGGCGDRPSGGCGGKPSDSGGSPGGGSGQLPLIPDYDGEIWASSSQVVDGAAFAGEALHLAFCGFPECRKLKEQVNRLCPVPTIMPEAERLCEAAKREYRKCCEYYGARRCSPICTAKSRIFATCCANARHEAARPEVFAALLGNCHEYAEYGDCDVPPCPKLECAEPPFGADAGGGGQGGGAGESPWLDAPTWGGLRPGSCLEWAREIGNVARASPDEVTFRGRMLDWALRARFTHGDHGSEGWNAFAQANSGHNIAHFSLIVAGPVYPTDVYGAIMTSMDEADAAAAAEDENLELLAERESELYADLATGLIRRDFWACYERFGRDAVGWVFCREKFAEGFYKWFCQRWI
jgi:hypothetical protein